MQNDAEEQTQDKMMKKNNFSIKSKKRTIYLK